MVLGSMRTSKGWNELRSEVEDQFNKWGFTDILFPTKRDSLNTGEVVVLVKTRGGDWQELKCGAFAGGDGPEKNFCAIREAVRGFRLADQRGIGTLFADMSKLLALPEAPAEDYPYSVLGVRKTDSPERVRTAYRARIKETHPDQGGDPDEFIKVREAGSALGVA